MGRQLPAESREQLSRINLNFNFEPVELDANDDWNDDFNASSKSTLS